MRIASVGHALFAVIMMALGIYGLSKGAVVQPWQPIPKWAASAQDVLAYLTALIALGSGIALLFRRSAPMASRVLFAALMTWLAVFRLPNLFYEKPLVLVGWTFGSTAVMAAGAWVLWVWFGGGRGVRGAQALYGVSLIPFGLAHFMYLDATTVLIPKFFGWPTGWAYLTGAAFILAGIATAVGVYARLAAGLSTLQMALFGIIIWIPRVLTGNVNDFQRGEAITNFVLMAGAWVVTDSLRDTPWTKRRA